MKRLTDRYTNKGIAGVCLKALDYKGNTADSGLILERLAEFEDFMQEQGFESFEELKIYIEYLKDKIKTDKFNYGQLHKFKNHLQQENQALKARWEKLKDFIDTFKEHNIDETSQAWKILDKMQELEK